jgi:hypothetical protein
MNGLFMRVNSFLAWQRSTVTKIGYYACVRCRATVLPAAVVMELSMFGVAAAVCCLE